MADADDVSSESQWYNKTPADQQPDYGQVISPARAVQEAVSQLGGNPDAAAVRRHLAATGMDLDETVIAELLAKSTA